MTILFKRVRWITSLILFLRHHNARSQSNGHLIFCSLLLLSIRSYCAHYLLSQPLPTASQSLCALFLHPLFVHRPELLLLSTNTTRGAETHSKPVNSTTANIIIKSTHGSMGRGALSAASCRSANKMYGTIKAFSYISAHHPWIIISYRRAAL